MSLYAVLLLSSASAGLIFSVFVYTLGRDRLSKNILAAYNLLFSLWCFCQFMGEIAVSPDDVLFWTRINLMFAALIPLFFVSFVYAFLGVFVREKTRLVFFAFVTALFVALLPTSYFIQGLSSTTYFRYYPKGGPAYGLFAFFFVIQVSSGFSALIRALRASSGARRNQISYVMLASVLGFGGGVLWFLPAFGFDIYPFGIFIMPLYLFAGAYAVVRHRLLDIKVVISSGIVYALMVSVFAGLYLGITAFVLRFIESGQGFISTLPVVLALFCFALLFDPLRRRFYGYVDRLLFGPGYDYKSTLKQLSFSVSSCLTVESLASLATGRLKEIIGLDDVAFYISDPNLKRYRGIKKSGAMRRLPDVYDVRSFPLRQKLSISMEEDRLSGEEDDFFRQAGASVFIPIVSGAVLKGFIIAGRKRGGQMWSGQDIDLLETFSANASVAAQNIFLSEKLMEGQFLLCQAEKSSAISMLAGEMAHEIKNPLTAMRGLMQVFSDNLSDAQFIKDFSAIMPRQIDRISSVVNRLLRLEAGAAGKLKEDVSVADLASDVLKLCAPQCESSSVSLVRDIGYPLKVKADRAGLEQALLNLILNAVQAMSGGGVLTVRTGKNLLEISDTGCGIKDSDLARVFEPFYTTKEGGAGLGLSVTKKILEDIGAQIEVSSRLGGGSVFTVRF